jgi:hypothetical protein
MQSKLAKRRKLALNKRSTNTLLLNGPFKEPATNASTSKTLNQTLSHTLSNTFSNTLNEAFSTSPKSPINLYAISKPTISKPSVLLTFNTHVLVEGGEIASALLKDILS